MVVGLPWTWVVVEWSWCARGVVVGGRGRSVVIVEWSWVAAGFRRWSWVVVVWCRVVVGGRGVVVGGDL